MESSDYYENSRIEEDYNLPSKPSAQESLHPSQLHAETFIGHAARSDYSAALREAAQITELDQIKNATLIKVFYELRMMEEEELRLNGLQHSVRLEIQARLEDPELKERLKTHFNDYVRSRKRNH